MAALIRDWMGSGLADFERALLYDQDKQHWGWLKWLPDGGNRIFTLSKSPFMGKAGIPTYYILPEGYDRLLTENQFVRIEVTGPPHEEKFPEQYKSFTVKSVETIPDRELLNILPHPKLYIEEFRREATVNFENAEKDNLDVVLPLQLVSCPSNETGRGGLTVRRESFLENEPGRADIVRQFKDGVLDCIPTGFKIVNPAYVYMQVTPGKEAGMERLRNKVREVNLMTDPGTSLNIHLPMIHLQSRYHFRQQLSADVVSYQLTALICQPHLRREDIKPIESSIKKARKRMEKMSVDFNMTPLAEVKVAEAFARMRLVQNNAIYKYLDGATGLLDSQRKVTEDLYHDLWNRQVEAYEDLRSAFDGVEIKGVQVAGKKRSVSISNFDANLSRRDISVYLEIRRLIEESGAQYVKRQELKKALAMDDAVLRESLDMLRNRGYIIMLQNGSLIKVFDLGEFSGRFDEALPR
ncbi:hypothetical protein [Methanocella sp. MCL-LM]|uniref:hypothetical protein n=1 Tax=Methanocella sp. MCL-LM TaxID=3412035 RepID=UPI003C750051